MRTEAKLYTTKLLEKEVTNGGNTNGGTKKSERHVENK